MIMIAKPYGRSRILGPVVVALMLSACGSPEDNDAVDEGSVSNQTSALKNGVLVDGSTRWRGVVALQVRPVGSAVWTPCTAVITSKKTVVTAAHCVTFSLGTYTSGTVVAKINRETSPGVYQTIMPESFVFAKYNPSYNNFAPHDIAVITANSPFLNVTQPESMPIAKGSPSGVSMYALGYGYFDTGVNDYDGQGRSGQLTVTYNAGTPDYTSAANATQPWMCSGDSGGPLKMVSSGVWMVFGIASWHSGAGKCGNSGHWSATANNWDWVQAAIGYGNCSESITAIFCW